MKFETIVKLLALVPEPHVQAAAGILTVVLAEVHREPLAFTPGPELAAALAAAVTDALEPWKRIQVRAELELHNATLPDSNVRHDVSGSIHTGELD